MSAGVQRAVKLISEPRAINIAQFILYSIAAVAGFAAVIGSLNPAFTSSTIGQHVIIGAGAFLLAGGLTGAVAIGVGMWWLECVALIILGTSWLMLIPFALYFAFTTHNSGIWLVIALLSTAVLSLFIRYRRIDWAYLDPTR